MTKEVHAWLNAMSKNIFSQQRVVFSMVLIKALYKYVIPLQKCKSVQTDFKGNILK